MNPEPTKTVKLSFKDMFMVTLKVGDLLLPSVLIGIGFGSLAIGLGFYLFQILILDAIDKKS